ncbi:MAG: hypothetical protein HYW49_00040 [Deltaproteobacteria bacterium]|nr:hypothetical protein [Deltaproteobacteria bacterium]
MPPIEKFDSLEKKLIEALGTLVAKDEHLLTNQATEWNLAQRISVYLETLFPGWDVDTEYGLDGKETKKLPLGRGREEVYSAPKVKTVRPDIIVHERGNAPGKESKAISQSTTTFCTFPNDPQRKSEGPLAL